ncbi:MAG: hypothetical protein ACPGOV_05000 [Magnetovibrionaceae bacterium]
MGFFKHFIGQRDRMPPPESRFFNERAPQKDSGLDALIVKPGSDVASLTVGIDYVDLADQTSTRQITIKAIDGPNVTAFCHLRRYMMTFDARRMKAVIDIETGERMAVKDLFGKLGRLPDSIEREVRKAVLPGVRVLVALAWADGGFDQEELDQVMAYCDAVAETEGLAFSDATYVDVGWIAVRLYPDWEDVSVALKTIGADRKKLQLLTRYLNLVADADGVLSDEETDFILEIDDVLKLLLD